MGQLANVRLEDVKGFADLLGVVLVFVTLFTGQRESALRTLRWSSEATRSDVAREATVTAVLLVLTLTTMVAGGKLFFETVGDLHPLANSGAIRALFAIIWVLLIGLVIWQIVILRDAIRLYPDVRDSAPPHRR
jgi:hypothetical protein